MKNKIIKIQFAVICLLILSCNKPSENKKDEEIDKPSISSLEYNFPHTAVKDGERFINQLLIVNNKINKTAIYSQKEFTNLYVTTKVSLPQGKVSIEDWTASSTDLFKKNIALKDKVKANFDKQISDLINLRKSIVKNEVKASPGVSGYVGSRDYGGFVRYVNGKGIEIAEVVEKQIMGIVLLDQILNEHLGNAIMKDESLREKNTNRIFMNGKQYTQLEYHWDIAFSLLGTDNREYKPKFIANYLTNEFQGADFLRGIDARVYDAFKKGRQALGNADYKKVEQNISTIRKELSLLYAARAIHYLRQSRANIDSEIQAEYQDAFHNLSETYGFISALIATRKSDGTFYISDYQILENMITDFRGENGFWDKQRLLKDESVPGSLDNISKRIADIYGLNYTKIQ